jgi:hypothetical protein
MPQKFEEKYGFEALEKMNSFLYRNILGFRMKISPRDCNG